jgi:hypothetical protein
LRKLLQTRRAAGFVCKLLKCRFAGSKEIGLFDAEFFFLDRNRLFFQDTKYVHRWGKHSHVRPADHTEVNGYAGCVDQADEVDPEISRARRYSSSILDADRTT